jgi:hypothetical protein
MGLTARFGVSTRAYHTISAVSSPTFAAGLSSARPACAAQGAATLAETEAGVNSFLAAPVVAFAGFDSHPHHDPLAMPWEHVVGAKGCVGYQTKKGDVNTPPKKNFTPLRRVYKTSLF